MSFFTPLFLLKLTIVPVFIWLVTLAGRRYGDSLAGLLGGLPMVAAPIVVFMLVEQGRDFAVATSFSAVSSVLCLLCFNLAYSWSTRSQWGGAWWRVLPVAWFVWVVSASVVNFLLVNEYASFSLWAALVFFALFAVPYVLPSAALQPKPVGSTPKKQLKTTPVPSQVFDIPLRMLSGAVLTVFVTGLAAWLGAVWSGLLAGFPIIGTVLAVFTHIKGGSVAVVNMQRSMVRGLYSLAAFFVVMYVGLSSETAALWVVTAATLVACIIQVVFNSVAKKQSVNS